MGSHSSWGIPISLDLRYKVFQPFLRRASLQTCAIVYIAVREKARVVMPRLCAMNMVNANREEGWRRV